MNLQNLTDNHNCNNCRKCLSDKVTDTGLPVLLTRMIVCPICGNKRCPKATNHEFSCTGSNELNQTMI